MPGECAPSYSGVFQLGGTSTVHAADGLRLIEWGRKLDDISRSRMVYVKRDLSDECCRGFRRLTPWRDHLNIVRNGRVVWFGPVMNVEESRNEIVIDAADSLVWMTRRVTTVDESFVQADLTDIARTLINDVTATADPWSATGVVFSYQPSGVLNDLLVESSRFPRYLWNVLTEKLASGLDMIVVSKTIHVGAAPPAPTLRFRAQDFQEDLSIRKDGGVYAASVFVNANDDVRAQYPPVTPGGNPFLVEQIISDAQIQTTQAATDTAKARWAYAGQQGVPVIVQASDNLTINPNTNVKVNQLIPGANVYLDATEYCFGRIQAFRLGSIAVAVEGNTEKIQIALQPSGPQALSDVSE